MPTHRYPLSDGREVEIADPIIEGRARIFLQGELLGEYTIHELKVPATFALADRSHLAVHVVSTVPLFRSFDVRHNGRPLPRSAGDPNWSRRTVIELLIFSALTHIGPPLLNFRFMPESLSDYADMFLLVLAVVTAIAVWQRVLVAGKAAQVFMFLQFAFASLHIGDEFSLNLDLVTFGLYFWMRHAANAMDEPVFEYTTPPKPQVTLT